MGRIGLARGGGDWRPLYSSLMAVDYDSGFVGGSGTGWRLESMTQGRGGV